MSKTYMQKEDKKGKRTGPIVSISLSDWARYRQSGYAFVEAEAPDEDGKLGRSPEQQFLDQTAAGVAKKESGDDGGNGGDEVPTMDNKKPEIVAYLVANDIEHEASATKAELLELI